MSLVLFRGLYTRHCRATTASQNLQFRPTSPFRTARSSAKDFIPFVSTIPVQHQAISYRAKTPWPIHGIIWPEAQFDMSLVAISNQCSITQPTSSPRPSIIQEPLLAPSSPSPPSPTSLSEMASSAPTRISSAQAQDLQRQLEGVSSSLLSCVLPSEPPILTRRVTI